MPLKLTRQSYLFVERQDCRNQHTLHQVRVYIVIGRWCLLWTQPLGSATRKGLRDSAYNTAFKQAQSAPPTSPQYSGRPAPITEKEYRDSCSAASLSDLTNLRNSGSL